MKAFPATLFVIVVFLGIVFVPFGALYWTWQVAGIEVSGEVAGKQEEFRFLGDERWLHQYFVEVRYRPLGGEAEETTRSDIGPPLYDRLEVGSRIRVRYLRFFGIGGAIPAEASLWSFIPERNDRRELLLFLASLVVLALLVALAYQTRNRRLAMAAGTAGAVFATAFALLGFVIFPLLLLLRLRAPGKEFGWMLPASALLTCGVLYLRIPWPEPLAPGRQLSAKATVEQVILVNKIWTRSRSSRSTLDLRPPIQMAELEFVPEGGTGPVRVVDRVDRSSVAGLERNNSVEVTYPESNPRAARLAGGSRAYAERAFVSVLRETFGGAAASVIVLWVLWIVGSRIRRAIRSRFERPGPGLDNTPT